MFELIKKDIITTIISNKKSNLQYLFILLFFYTFLNPISYFTVNIIISYLILISSFKQDYENNSENFILSMPVNKENLVYSKYIFGFSLIIITTVMNSIITWILGGVFYRGSVLNDVLISNIIFLTIISIILPIIFKFGYRKSKVYINGVSIILGFVGFGILSLITDKIYNDFNSIDVFYSFGGPLSKIFEYIIYDMNTKYVNLYSIAFASSLIFILSMILSIRIIKDKNIINFKKFFIVAIIIVIIFNIHILVNKKMYGNIVYMQDYDDNNEINADINLDGYQEVEEGTLVRFKIINRSKYRFILEKVNLDFGKEIMLEDNSYTFASFVSLDYYKSDLNNNKLMQDGIEPFGEKCITFLMPKGLKLGKESFDLNNVNIEYSYKFVVDLPIINKFTSVSSGGGSYNFGNLNTNNYE
ncbi:ABC-2 transporter permease [Romboutsia ilealis]|uniref:ABC-2 transporter permease n=1 Tax=Romboutsia faecis TaxID=2764597 RepID=A0ABR7JLG0_9FIRM|nr:ABC-2 transporter permease [Romboutsia faecis]MBC5995771.1 ABC-2 transporter permease [Romboutsia faecis]MRN23972.1 ABC-2 transporter permease [Romboutsia ilealis]